MTSTELNESVPRFEPTEEEYLAVLRHIRYIDSTELTEEQLRFLQEKDNTYNQPSAESMVN